MPTSSLTAAARLVLTLGLLVPAAARAHVAEFEAVLDTAQEIPAPKGTTTAAGTGTFVLEEDGTIEATVVFQGLTGAPVAAHIHQGAPGVSGPVLIDFSSSVSGLGASGTIAGLGARPLTSVEQEALFAGEMYFNIHTPTNIGGEIRGQIRLASGKCSCDDAKSPGAFKRCVKKAIRGIEKAERDEDSVKTLRRLAAKSACGKTKAPKKAVACCLPFTPAQNIVIERMCGSLKEAQCARAGGTSLGTGVACSPNPCGAGSPSGAFVESAS